MPKAPAGVLVLKSNFESKVKEMENLGKEGNWSSEGLYHHLCRLQGLVSALGDYSTRMWIDAIFYRAAAMAPPGKRMVLVSEPLPISPSPNYVAVLTDKDTAEMDLILPSVMLLKQRSSALCVIEAKKGINIEEQIDHAVGILSAYGSTFSRPTTRGILTNGQIWIFLIVHTKSYPSLLGFAPSKHFSVSSSRPSGFQVCRHTCDMISGIIISWLEHATDYPNRDEWFNVREIQWQRHFKVPGDELDSE